MVMTGLALVTLALWYYTRVELPVREERRTRQAMRAFAKAIELRFPTFSGSSERVAALSVFVGREMGLDPWSLNELELAAYLGEVGLAAIPYELLNKKPRMRWTDADLATFSRYPEVSAAMIELIPHLRRLAPIVRCHKANFDGSSGPYFPHGHQLPVEARILKAASDYVAIERQQGQLLAREALRDGAGTLYDPEVVAAFVGIAARMKARDRAESVRVTSPA